MCFMIFIRKHIVLWLMLLSIVSFYGQNLPPFTSLDSDTLTWVDKNGVNLLLLETSDIITDANTNLRSKNLQATHWLKKEGQLIHHWSYQDEITECPVDLEMKFLAAPQFSDLNNDGIYEIWMMIQKACKGDISPSLVEVIMVDERKAKYFLTAEEQLIFPNGTIYGGSYDLEDFTELPIHYQEYAVTYLLQHYKNKF